MIEPISLLSGFSGAITAAVTASNLVNGLRNCPEEVKTCFSHVKLVHGDVQHAVTLRTKHRDYLAQRPMDAKRIDDIITSASTSLTSIGALVERLRADAHGGKVPYPQKLRWVLGDSASFALRTRDLQAQHTAIQGEISWLRLLDFMGSSGVRAEPSTSFDNLDLWKGKEANYDISEVEFENVHLTPESQPRSTIHRVPSSQTLVGSVSDLGTDQPGIFVSQWVENTQVPYQGYMAPHGYSELPAYTEPHQQWTPSVTSPYAASDPGPIPVEEHEEVPEEECDDGLGSFFRSWKEDQAERKRENHYLT